MNSLVYDLNQCLDFEALTWLGLFKTIWTFFVYKPTECTPRLREFVSRILVISYAQTTLYCINVKCQHWPLTRLDLEWI